MCSRNVVGFSNLDSQYRVFGSHKSYSQCCFRLIESLKIAIYRYVSTLFMSLLSGTYYYERNSSLQDGTRFGKVYHKFVSSFLPAIHLSIFCDYFIYYVQ